MIICDIFELTLTLKDEGGPFIEYNYYTDLPAGTRIFLSCERTYIDLSEEECVWGGYDEEIFVEPATYGDFNGGSGRIDVVESDKQALKLFNQINKNFSSSIKAPVSDVLTIDLIVGARQRLKAFGKNNSELSGQMVHDSGGINIVNVSESITLPMLSELQPVWP